MPDFTIKQGDTKPPIQVQLKNADGSITDLTGSSVDIHIKDKIDVVVIDVPMSIVGAENNGTVEWDPTIVLSDIIGRYRIEFEKHYPELDYLFLNNLSLNGARWGIAFMEKKLDDSAFNLGLKIVPVEVTE